MQKIMTLEEAHDQYEDTGLPEGFGLKALGGRVVYQYIGYMWRRSGNTIYMTNSIHDDLKSRRYLPGDTVVELVGLKQLKEKNT
jgi:hypothetical protein